MLLSHIDRELKWAQNMFSASQMGDRRLPARLIVSAALHAADAGASTSRACRENNAARQGAYRLFDNKRVTPEGILQGPSEQTRKQCEGRSRILVIQDSTSMKVDHPELFEEVKGRGLGGANGLGVHSAIAADGDTGEVLGLVDQLFWLAPAEKIPSERRSLEQRESIKWSKSLFAGMKLLGPKTITVADREADDYHFLGQHVEQGVDYVIRAKFNRKLSEEAERLLDVAKAAPVIGSKTINIAQRGAQLNSASQDARPARKASTVEGFIQVARVEIPRPPRLSKDHLECITVNVVRISTKDKDKTGKPLEWVLLTSLPTDTLEQAKQVIKDYEHRWLIEEFHKAWKTGCNIEHRPFHTLHAMKNVMAMTAPIALRLMQMRDIAHKRSPDRPCTHFLTTEEWQCLWTVMEAKPLPDAPPSTRWACESLARMAGWRNAARTGRIGWQTIWYGYRDFRLILLGRLGPWKAPRAEAEM